MKILESKKSAGIKPANIVAFTFTEKAAGELKDRIQRLCLEHLKTDQGLAEMYVGTIHEYSLNLLQQPPGLQFSQVLGSNRGTTETAHRPKLPEERIS